MTVEWRKANPDRPWNGSFQFRRIRIKAAPGNRLRALRPILTADLVYQGNRFPTFALIDSGADWSLIPWEVALELGIDVATLPGPDRGVSGSTGAGRGRAVEVELDLRVNPPPGPMILPFVAMRPPLDTKAASTASKTVLVGRHPFFEWFDIHFRMGYTTDPDLGKWTVRQVTKKHPADMYRKAPTMPTVEGPVT